tara:strand:+ start:2131 stop:2376 length:246 start_codon:yes stop_codon:yes gene_type:complete
MKYRVVIDLGWHEADNAEQSVLVATSKKYHPEQMAYLATSEDRLDQERENRVICTSKDCITISKEEMWAHYEDREYWWGDY